MGAHQPPMLTCEAVIAESCFLLRHLENGSESVLKLIDPKVLHIGFRLAEEHSHIMKYLRRCANIPMSLADACLVRMVEQYSDSRIFTLDQDFCTYRKHGRQTIPVLMPL